MDCKGILWGLLTIVYIICAPSAGLASIEYDTTTLVVSNDKHETMATVSAKVADHPLLHYRGLSDFDRLDTGAGMWFVYPESDTRTFVMRDMSFPIDILFVDAAHRITRIHSAPVEDTQPYTPYRGRGKNVLEVPYNWSRRVKASVGDLILPSDSFPLTDDSQ